MHSRVGLPFSASFGRSEEGPQRDYLFFWQLMAVKSKVGIFSMRACIGLWAIAISVGCVTPSFADTYTYKYVGPTFSGGTAHVEVMFTTSAPLTPSKSFLKAADAGVISSSALVVGPTGPISGFTLPITTFQIHTNAMASVTTPGIDGWFLFGEANNLVGTAPTMTGTDIQAYTMNTMLLIPGSDIVPTPPGLVTGHYNYDQATKTTFYASCSGVPNCVFAGNGQPYVSNYSGIINPSLSSPGSWQITKTATTTPPPPLSLSGSLANGTINNTYSSRLTATGGKTPYTWSASGLPSGLSISSSTGIVSGTPKKTGTYPVSVTVKDASTPQQTATKAATITIGPVSCGVPNGATSSEGVGTITQVGSGYIVVGTTVVQVPSCANIFLNGASGFATGQTAEWQGYKTSTMTVATTITIN